MHLDGPLLILAGPGSGKTRVITHRIARLLADGVPDGQILALTFTNKAAEEMRSRVERLAPGRSVWVSTFHRFCARLLRKYAPLVGLQENYTIYDAGDSAQTLRRVIAEAKIDAPALTPEAIGRAISWAKNNLISAEKYQPRLGHELGTVVKRVYPAYQAKLAASNAVDFDDLLFHVAALLGENPEVRAALDERYRYILVDEYQDTNLAQYAIARAMSIDYPNLAVTGDPDQSIYGWRGANLNNILEFEKDFPDVRVVRLERNYRSTKRILRVAAELIAHNVRRKEKGLYTENGAGPPVRLVTYRHPAGRGRGHCRADRRADRRRRPPRRRFRRLLSHQRPEPGAGIRPAQPGRAVPDGQRPGIPPAQGNQGHPGLPATAEQSPRRDGAAAGDQHARRAASAERRSTAWPPTRRATA